MSTNQSVKKKLSLSTFDIVSIALCTALIAVCAWINIPMTVPFTMQTFAVFFAVAYLGIWKSFLSIFAYLLLGIVGVPVFAGIRGGLDVLLGVTGGYLVGFLFVPFVTGTILALIKNNFLTYVLAMVAGLVVCYLFGTVWFMIVYLNKGNSIGFIAVLAKCVFPFLLPDGAKIVLASIVTLRLKKSQIGKNN